MKDKVGTKYYVAAWTDVTKAWIPVSKMFKNVEKALDAANKFKAKITEYSTWSGLVRVVRREVQEYIVEQIQ